MRRNDQLTVKLERPDEAGRSSGAPGNLITAGYLGGLVLMGSRRAKLGAGAGRGSVEACAGQRMGVVAAMSCEGRWSGLGMGHWP